MIADFSKTDALVVCEPIAGSAFKTSFIARALEAGNLHETEIAVHGDPDVLVGLGATPIEGTVAELPFPVWIGRIRVRTARYHSVGLQHFDTYLVLRCNRYVCLILPLCAEENGWLRLGPVHVVARGPDDRLYGHFVSREEEHPRIATGHDALSLVRRAGLVAVKTHEGDEIVVGDAEIARRLAAGFAHGMDADRFAQIVRSCAVLAGRGESFEVSITRNFEDGRYVVDLRSATGEYLDGVFSELEAVLHLLCAHYRPGGPWSDAHLFPHGLVDASTAAIRTAAWQKSLPCLHVETNGLSALERARAVSDRDTILARLETEDPSLARDVAALLIV